MESYSFRSEIQQSISLFQNVAAIFVSYYKYSFSLLKTQTKFFQTC